jgi:hypothetical protein
MRDQFVTQGFGNAIGRAKRTVARRWPTLERPDPLDDSLLGAALNRLR